MVPPTIHIPVVPLQYTDQWFLLQHTPMDPSTIHTLMVPPTIHRLMVVAVYVLLE